MRFGVAANATRVAATVAYMLFVGALIPCDGGNRKARYMAPQSLSSTPTYARRYADERLSSSLSVIAKGAGAIGAKVPLSAGKEPPFLPVYLLNSGSYVVACSKDKIAVVDRSGSRLWTEEIWHDSPVQLFAGKVYFRKRTGPINELGVRYLDGRQDATPIYILDTHSSAGPVYIEPRERELVALCVYQLGPEEGPPESSLYSKELSTKEYLWVQSVKGSLIMLPLHLSALHKYVVFTAEHAVVYDAKPDAGNFTEETAFPYPIRRPGACSASHDGTLYFCSADGNSILVSATDLAGKEKWRWQQTMLTRVNREDLRPPALSSDGSVIVSIGSTLTAIKDGTTAWHFDAPDMLPVGPGTVLGDGCVLVSAGDRLFHLSAGGSILYDAKLDEMITTPPVCDESGAVCAAGARTLFRMK